MERPRLLYVVTHPMSAQHLLRGQLGWMRAAGFEVAVAASPGTELEEVAAREGVTIFPVPIPREIEPARDLHALLELYRLMRGWRPDIVNASTPKAGLLGMLAARAARAPARIYVVRGLRLETASGVKRQVLVRTERLAAAGAHRVIGVSASLATTYVAQGLAPASKVKVLGAGSSNGVNVGRFVGRPDGETAEVRAALGLPTDAPVIGFVGRLTRDKGLVELVEAFARVRRAVPDAWLLIIGDFEAGDPVPEATERQIREAPGIVCAGFARDVAQYYPVMSVLAFPSHREGFPNVPLEAAAAGLPVAGFRATGTIDAVVDGVTGTLVETGDVYGLATALTRYLTEPALRREHGRAGQERAREEFQSERVWKALLEEYRMTLHDVGRGFPSMPLLEQ